MSGSGAPDFCSGILRVLRPRSERQGFILAEGGAKSQALPGGQKVDLLANLLLLKYQLNEPITKADMLTSVIKKYKDHFPEILRRTTDCMELLFGIDVKEVDPKSHCYLLVNKLDLTYDGRLSGDDGMPKTGLLILILGVIFMKGNCATDEEVWEVMNMMNMMNIYSGRKHFLFGEPRKIITGNFVKEKYLEYRQVPNSDPPCYEFLWGPRAQAEANKMKLLEFLAKIHGMSPRCFLSQYEEALKDEQERGQARIADKAGTTTLATASSTARFTFLAGSHDDDTALLFLEQFNYPFQLHYCSDDLRMLLFVSSSLPLDWLPLLLVQLLSGTPPDWVLPTSKHYCSSLDKAVY
nr:melanoma-associated antigen B16-like [Dasypus novemcinctus]